MADKEEAELEQSTAQSTTQNIEQRTGQGAGQAATSGAGGTRPDMKRVERPGPEGEELPEEHRRVLLVAAHPDDPEFSSAGTVARWIKSGIEVVYVLATSGDRGSQDRTMTPERLREIREGEQKAAAEVVGVKQVEFLRFGDGQLMPNIELRGAVTRMIRKYKPYAVMTHDPITLFYENAFVNHPDHRAIGQAVVDAIYPTARDPLYFPEHLEEGFEPHKVKEIYLWGSDQPNVLIDISDGIDSKIEALKKHASQVGPPEELAERIKARSAQVGEMGGMQYAESFRRVVMRM